MTNTSEVPRTLNQSAYSFSPESTFRPCLLIRTEVAWDYSLIPSKRRKSISFWLICRNSARCETRSTLIKWQDRGSQLYRNATDPPKRPIEALSLGLPTTQRLCSPRRTKLAGWEYFVGLSVSNRSGSVRSQRITA
jgi:hypothetical protein